MNISELEATHKTLLAQHKQTGQALHGAETAVAFLTAQKDEEAKQLQGLFEQLNELRNPRFAGLPGLDTTAVD